MKVHLFSLRKFLASAVCVCAPVVFWGSASARAATPEGSVQFSNSLVRVECSSDNRALTVTDLRTKRIWRQTWLETGSAHRQSAVQINARDQSATFECTLPGSRADGKPGAVKAQMKVHLHPDRPDLELTFEVSDRSGWGKVAYPYAFVLDGEGVHNLYPHAEGLLVPARKSDPDWFALPDGVLYGGVNAYLMCLGLVDERSGEGLLTLLPDMEATYLRWRDAQVGPHTVVTPQLEWKSNKGTFDRPWRITYSFSDRDGHVALAKRYREFFADSGLHKTLREKAVENPAVAQMAGAPIFWSAARRPVETSAMADILKAQGIDRCLFAMANVRWRKPDPAYQKEMADAIRHIRSPASPGRSQSARRSSSRRNVSPPQPRSFPMFSLSLKIRVGPILFAALMCAGSARGAAPVEKPNVLFFLMDDLGWRDTGFAGSDFYETPNIDQLAKRGVVFTQAYSAAPICSPTRASLITGLYPARIGLTLPRGGDPAAILKSTVQEKPCTWIEAKQNKSKVSGLEAGPANQRTLQVLSATRLSTEYPTAAKIFKANGYRTAHFGKWHVGPAPYSPIEHGFDVDDPHVNSAGPLRPGHFGPWPDWDGESAPASKGRQIDEVLAEHAVRFIEENKESPFYMNFWTYGVHLPFQAKAEVIEHFKAKAKSDALQRNPLYAAMIKHTDDAIGKVWQAVEACGLVEKTVVVFLSDNGGVDNKMTGARREFEGIPVTSNAPLRGGKGDSYEGGVRIPGFVIWPGKTKAASEGDVPWSVKSCG